MSKKVCIIGGGLAGSEAALTLAKHGINVDLYEMRPTVQTPVHHTGNLAELVCSNSLKSTREDSAAGMLKRELEALGSSLYKAAMESSVPAGGALAVDREKFSNAITTLIEGNPSINVIRDEATDIECLSDGYDALILATGPLTSDKLADSIAALTGSSSLAFYDAAAPIVMADSLDMDKLFRQSRYEDSGSGDYLNAALSKEEYDRFVDALLSADRVIAKNFETKELFQACQPIEEIARKGKDAPRFGTMKPVGLTDPRTGRRPWATLQLRAEDANGQSYNLVGFQTNLTFPEQTRIFRMIPGLENAEFARYGVMHRNTYINAPTCIDKFGKLIAPAAKEINTPIYVAGQLAGTEGYCEAIRSGLHVAIALASELEGNDRMELPKETAFGALMDYASNPDTEDYQPMHVNFGIFVPLDSHIRNKRERYRAYAERGNEAILEYRKALEDAGYGF